MINSASVRVCPRCTVDRPGWVINENGYIHCVMCGFILSDPGFHTSRWDWIEKHAAARKQRDLQTVSSPAQIINEIPSDPLPGKDWVKEHRDDLSTKDFHGLTMSIKMGEHEITIPADSKLRDIRAAIASLQGKVNVTNR